MSQILEDLVGVICHMDDILIHAADQAEHDKRVGAVLGRIQEAGLALNTIKCQWGSGTWYPLDVAPGDETEHIIAQASVTTLSFAFK